MILLPHWSDNPTLAVMMEDVATDASSADLVITWLVDEVEATLEEIVRWYAWPPSWLRDDYQEDEAAREVFWRWLKWTEPETTAYIREGDMAYAASDKRGEDVFRWQFVKTTVLPIKMLRRPVVASPEQELATIERGVLRQKRAVLAAFGDVEGASSWIPSGIPFRPVDTATLFASQASDILREGDPVSLDSEGRAIPLGMSATGTLLGYVVRVDNATGNVVVRPTLN